MRPDARVQVAGRGDHRPAGPADVTRVQHHGGDSARQRLAVQQRLDLRLARAVVAVRGARLVLGDRHPQRGAVHPDRPAVQQQRAGRAQRLDELARRGRGEADQVDDHVGVQRRDPPAEGPRGVFGVPVHRDPGDPIPLRGRVVGVALAPAQGDHLVTAPHQPRHQVGADVPGCADDHYATHPRSSLCVLPLLEPVGQVPGDLRLRCRLGVHQPPEVVAGEPQELPGLGADHGGQASVAGAAAPVPRGELAEVIPGPRVRMARSVAPPRRCRPRRSPGGSTKALVLARLKGWRRGRTVGAAGWRVTGGAVLPGHPRARRRSGHGPPHDRVRGVRGGRIRRVDRHAGLRVRPRRGHGRRTGRVRPAGTGDRPRAGAVCPGRPPVADPAAGGWLCGAGAGHGRCRGKPLDGRATAGGLRPGRAGQHGDDHDPAGAVRHAACAGSRRWAAHRGECGGRLGREPGRGPVRTGRVAVPGARADRHAFRGVCRSGGGRRGARSRRYGSPGSRWRTRADRRPVSPRCSKARGRSPGGRDHGCW